jgi:hypothetical protein
VNAQFRIAHDVDEKNVGDFQSEFRFLIVAHRVINLGGSREVLYTNFGKSRSARPRDREQAVVAPLPLSDHEEALDRDAMR